MGERKCFHIAAKMLDIDPHDMSNTHPDLYQWIQRVDRLCEKADGGELVSRQVIAMMVDTWQQQEDSK